MSTRILVNATTLVVGGGMQIGKSLIEYASRMASSDMKLVFAISAIIHENLAPELRADPRVKLFPISPAPLFSGRAARKSLLRLETEFQPDIVYTLGLPSYVRFRSPEVGRYTNPWEIHPTALALTLFTPYERMKLLLKTQYRLFWARRAKFFETQTEAAKAGIMNRLQVSADRVKVIPNSPNPVFLRTPVDLVDERQRSPDPITVFCLAAPYRHKNLGFIPDVARQIRASTAQKFHFIVTVPQSDRIAVEIAEKSRHLGVEDMISNVGSLNLSDCVEWYRRCDLVFLPTLLEVFSATYLEAMAMRRPIVTSDLDFAHSVCAEAAVYYDPRSALAAAEAILAVAADAERRSRLVERGVLRLAEFPTANEKHRMLFDWLREIARRELQSEGH